MSERLRVVITGGNAESRREIRQRLERDAQGPRCDIVEAEAAWPEPGQSGWPQPQDLEPLWQRIEQRMGVCPSFFRMARHEPAIARALYDMAEFAYLDNPIPSRFKEQLFTYLSRFCPVPYCLARHCAFLLGHGTMAGDRSSDSISVEDARRLVDEPLPDADSRAASLHALEQCTAPIDDWPAWESELGRHVRFACSQVFLHSHRASRWLFALQRLLGKARYEQLALFLAFIRTAHFWTEIHPELDTEVDVQQLLNEYEELSVSLASATRSAEDSRVPERLHIELQELRRRADHERRVRQLASALPAYISYVDTEQRFVFVNQTYIERFQRNEDDIIGRPVAEVIGADTFEQVRPRLEAALRGQRLRFDQKLSIPAQGERHLDVSYVPDRRPDGSIAGCFVLAMDVTERKQAEQELARAHDLLHTVTETVPDPIFAKDREGRMLLANRATLRAIGKSSSEVLGHNEAEWHDDPEQARAIMANDRRIMESGRTEVVEELLTTPDGTRIFAATKVPLIDKAGDVIGLVGVSHDITEERRKEQALEQSQQRLEELDRRKNEYLAMLGHELRNPLAAIRHAAELVKHLTDREPLLDRVHGVLDRQAGHMTRLIDGLLEVSRIARGKVHLQQKALDVRSVVRGVLHDRRAQLTHKAGDGKVTLEQRLPSEPVWVFGDDVRLAQVFDNLVGNAMKFTSQGTITVDLCCEGSSSVMRIRDTGAGIRPEMLTTIFEPFQQDSHELVRAAGGLGLGLALVKGLVELHGGSVEARSEGPGKGAEFVVRLPLSQAPGNGDVQRPRPVAAPAQRILLVEDNADAAQMLRDLLEMQGHEVLLADSASRALAMLRDHGAEIVLCDIGLPGMSGYDLARAVRHDPALRGTALVAVTGFGQREDRRRTIEAGFDAHLVKPVSLDAVEDTIRRLARPGKRARPEPGAPHGEPTKNG